MRIFAGILLFVLALLPSWAGAEAYSYDDHHSVIGSTKKDLVENGDSLIEMARRYNIGYNAITDANPTLDPFVPGEDSDVVLPTSWVLPDVASYSGIVINISEMRLYFFYGHGKAKLVETFPIGIGSEGTETPTGQFKIIQKITKPSWYPPESIGKNVRNFRRLCRPDLTIPSVLMPCAFLSGLFLSMALTGPSRSEGRPATAA